jgi:hypothetical protein
MHEGCERREHKGSKKRQTREVVNDVSEQERGQRKGKGNGGGLINPLNKEISSREYLKVACSSYTKTT